MLERHYSHLEVLHRAEALAGRNYQRKKTPSLNSKAETKIIILDQEHHAHHERKIDVTGTEEEQELSIPKS